MDTKDVIAEMLCENTGRHMLDSGGAYGRNFERNKNRDFEKEPILSLEIWKDQFIVNISTYHYLTAHIEYSESMDHEFQDFASKQDKDMCWPEIMEQFATNKNELKNVLMIPKLVNTYNFECLVDQALQYVIFSHNGIEYIILQIHGGCDVRGGYTKPKVFKLNDDYFETDMNTVYGVQKYLPNRNQTGLKLYQQICELLKLYTDDGYHWYDNDGCIIIDSDWAFDEENQKVFVRGQEMKFYCSWE